MVFSSITTSQEVTGSANDRFMGRSIRTLLPNSYNLELKTGELMEKLIANHEKRITKKNSNNKILYQIGERVRLQNIVTKEFKLFGTITNLRLADDGAVVHHFLHLVLLISTWEEAALNNWRSASLR